MGATRTVLRAAGPVLRAAGAATTAAAVIAVGAATTASADSSGMPEPAAHTAPIVMVLLDNHGPPGRRISAERQAVLRYLAAVPARVRTGLITFNSSWQLQLPPTTDRHQMAQALRAVRAAHLVSTGIYAAIAGAESLIRRGHAPWSRLLVLSNAEEVLSRFMTPALPVDVIPWHYDGDDNIVELRALASASRGHVASPRRAASLAAVFAHQPKAPATRPGTSSPATAPARTASARAVAVPWLLIAGLTAVFLALFLVALMLLRPLRPGNPRRIASRIERYGPRRATTQAGQSAAPGRSPQPGRPAQPRQSGRPGQASQRASAGTQAAQHVQHGQAAREGWAAEPEPPDPDAAEEGTAAHAALGLATSVLRSTNTERGLAQRLDHAGIARSPAEWVVLTTCCAVVLAAALTVLTGNALLGIPAGALAGWAATRLVVSFRTTRRRAAFGEQLPDVLRLVAGSLQSGFSLPQAVDAVVREEGQPAAGEFSRALAEVRVGADLGDALDRVADRMKSTDLHLTVMAVRIQRDVGGNLAEVLQNSVGTMRERAFLRRQVRALSAEGRMSAYILLVLPFMVGAWFFYMDPKYMSLLYTTVPGLLMLAGSVVLIGVGVLWMRKLIDIEV
jgi:Flp pilus assembly protein TadB